MITYRDRSFCAQEECASFDHCAFAANDKLKAEAEASGLPISLTKYEGCFEPK